MFRIDYIPPVRTGKRAYRFAKLDAAIVGIVAGIARAKEQALNRACADIYHSRFRHRDCYRIRSNRSRSNVDARRNTRLSAERLYGRGLGIDMNTAYAAVAGIGNQKRLSAGIFHNRKRRRHIEPGLRGGAIHHAGIRSRNRCYLAAAHTPDAMIVRVRYINGAVRRQSNSGRRVEARNLSRSIEKSRNTSCKRSCPAIRRDDSDAAVSAICNENIARQIDGKTGRPVKPRISADSVCVAGGGISGKRIDIGGYKSLQD